MRGRTKEELRSIHLKFNSILDAVQLSIQKTFGEMISIFWSRTAPLSALPLEYKKLRLRMNRGLCLGEGVLSGPADGVGERGLSGLADGVGERVLSGSADGAGEGVLSGSADGEGSGGSGILESLLLYPPLPMLVETLQKEQAVLRVKEIFEEIRRKKRFSAEVLLSVYHTVTGIIGEDSIRRDIVAKDTGKYSWQQGLEEFFISFGSVRSLGELEENCTRAVEQYIAYVKGTELHLAGTLAENIKE